MTNSLPKQIYSVSALTEKLKQLLEKNFSMVWISGEISNFRMPSSGHAYFTLKDDRAQIAAVMFRGQLRQLKFELENGLVIVALGRISVFESRGVYQVILEYVEPKSAGSLQLAFEQLKRKLAQEGLFDIARKRQLPFLPENISIITSPTGAVLHDILHILHRRCRRCSIEIVPARVQGEGAEKELVRAIEIVNRRSRAEVIILARGGGSLEDLAAFNSEALARAICASQIPIISAVGHETDYTIADFVADVRAPTPSAAAELIVPLQSDLQKKCTELRRRCLLHLERSISLYRDRLFGLTRRLVHPRRRVQELQQRMDESIERLQRAVRVFMRQQRMAKDKLVHRLFIRNPVNYLNRIKADIEFKRLRLQQLASECVMQNKGALGVQHAALLALSPKAVLERGYSITRTIPERKVVTEALSVCEDQALEVLLDKGLLKVTVVQRKPTL